MESMNKIKILRKGEEDMKGDFLRCGATGWCLEIFWTGLHAIGRKEWKMMGQSSLWMFPIYGMAACIGPISRYLKKIPRKGGKGQGIKAPYA